MTVHTKTKALESTAHQPIPAYQGWVHITSVAEFDAGGSPPGAESQDSLPDEFPQIIERHFNTQTGDYAEMRSQKGGKASTFFVAANGNQLHYQDGESRIFVDSESRQPPPSDYPSTLDEFLTGYRTASRREPLSIATVSENDLDHHTITLFENVEQANKSCVEGGICGIGTAVQLWCHHHSGRIARMQIKPQPELTIETTFNFGDPKITSLYDLGVPRHLPMERRQHDPDWLTESNRFSPRALQALQFSAAEARTLAHEYVGTERLLLGLAREETEFGRGPLLARGLAVSLIRQEVEKLAKRGTTPPATHLGKTPRTRNVILHARKTAERAGGYFIEPEHLIIGLLIERQGLACNVFTNLGLSPDELLRQLVGDPLNGNDS